MIRFICKLIWDFSEWSGLPLGRFAPWVFGGMIGSKPHKVKQEGE